jgi:hypothetical protein
MRIIITPFVTIFFIRVSVPHRLCIQITGLWAKLRREGSETEPRTMVQSVAERILKDMC